jgi:hypothetical protein
MKYSRAFINGFLIGLLIFLLANLLAAQVLSDCGLPSFFGLDHCADDIARAGFPLVFFEDGGFAYHHMFNQSLLLWDIFIGLDFAIVSGFVARKIAQRRDLQNTQSS